MHVAVPPAAGAPKRRRPVHVQALSLRLRRRILRILRSLVLLFAAAVCMLCFSLMQRSVHPAS